ncbi:sodium bile acid symporter family-domain-containing protein [Chytriomyces sp. MP71]|nr:sodium bile acid symporter family-domain-containing protein [Chytriomyces sp. MP71]
MTRGASRLSWFDKVLPLNILIVMVVGTLIGHYVPSASPALNSGSIVGVSLPIFIGLIWMMYPVLCKVKYETLPHILSTRTALRTIAFSMLINALLAPLLMTALAWLTLPDLPQERAGIILVGVARCIAMVLIWNNLAGGDAEWCAVLVAVNALVQVLTFGPVAYLLTVVLGAGGGTGVGMGMWFVVRSVLLFLGVPLVLGGVTRFLVLRMAGEEWYEGKFMPWVEPQAVVGLLYTILVMFIQQGDQIIRDIPRALRTSVPLLLYFGIVFSLTFFACLYLLKTPHKIAVTQSFTAAGNNFELAIAVAIANYGIDSREAFATVIGPLIEVPVLISLVYVAIAIEEAYNRVLLRLKGEVSVESTDHGFDVRYDEQEETGGSIPVFEIAK